MATACSHQDPERRGVSSTAFAVAYARNQEFKVYGEKALFVDPYAEALAGEFDIDAIQRQFRRQPKNSEEKKIRRLDQVSVRTIFIDNYMKRCIYEGITQICVLGAGLDTRAWRIKDVNPSGRTIKFYELDFPEIFDYKLPVLNKAGAVSAYSYHSITADLSLDSWTNSLKEASFDPALPSLWVLEGFTGYLQETELRTLFTKMNELIAHGSRMVASFIGKSRGERTLTLHRFFTDDPLAFCSEFGWAGTVEDMPEMEIKYGRAKDIDESAQGYYFVTVEK